MKNQIKAKKTAYQTKAVANTTVFVLIYKGEVAGHIVTGHTINGNGCTSTCSISKGILLTKSNDYGLTFTCSCTMAGGGMNFGSETRMYAVKGILEKLGVDFSKLPSGQNPMDFLQRKGYKIVKLY